MSSTQRLANQFLLSAPRNRGKDLAFRLPSERTQRSIASQRMNVERASYGGCYRKVDAALSEQ